jgi:hypothetical protein
VELVRDGLLVDGLLLVEVHLGGGNLGLGALVRQLLLVARPRRGLGGLLPSPPASSSLDQVAGS